MAVMASPAEAFAAASNGCNMTTENVRGAATTLWGARGATAGEFVAAPPDLWMQKSSEARRLIGDHRTHFMPLMVVFFAFTRQWQRRHRRLLAQLHWLPRLPLSRGGRHRQRPHRALAAPQPLLHACR